ncbi:TetR/AcrR family transcriptional regulator [Kitasatospora sp. NPDC058032]|uniref:TetR/AcrR family transcriptional regulator n=1 Tax=unclassified Kitasatospora TaxID=2633591 RepID=UPI0033A43504
MSMREQIVDAAERVIRDLGLARCTTKEIAEVAGCSEGTIYRHFRSKEDVFLAVLAERLPGLLPVLRALPEEVTSEGEVRAALQQVAEEALAFYRESMPMLLSVFAEPKLLDRHREWMQANNAGPHRAAELLADYLRRAQRADLVSRDADPVAAAQLLLGACYLAAYGGVFASPAGGSEALREAEAFVRQLWRTLAPVDRPAAPAKGRGKSR